MLDIEGAEGPADVAIIGNEEQVSDQLSRLAEGGVTEFSAVIAAPNSDDHSRTWDLLKSLI
jgi:hypothetical protein